MRIGVLAAALLGLAWPAVAADAPLADDPLAELENARLDARSNGKRPNQAVGSLTAMAPVKPDASVTPSSKADELPASFDTGPSFKTGTVPPPPAPSRNPTPSPSGGDRLTPTAPTPPTLPSFSGPLRGN